MKKMVMSVYRLVRAYALLVAVRGIILVEYEGEEILIGSKGSKLWGKRGSLL